MKLLLVFLFFVPLCFAQQSDVFLARTKNSIHLDSIIENAKSFLTSSDDEYSRNSAEVSALLINAYTRRGDLVTSERQIGKLLNNPKKIQDDYSYAIILRQRALLYSYERNFGEALTTYFHALALTNKLEDNELKISLIIDLAEFYRRTAEFEKGHVELNRARELIKKHGLKNKKELVRIMARTAAINNEQDKKQLSISQSLEAIELAKKYNSESDIAVSWNEIGGTYKSLNMFDSSFVCYDRAYDIYTKLGLIYAAYECKGNKIVAISHSHSRSPTENAQLNLNFAEEVLKKKLNIDISYYYYLAFCSFQELNDTENQLKSYKKYHAAYLDENAKQNQMSVLIAKQHHEDQLLTKDILSTKKELNSSLRLINQKKKENNQILIFASIMLLAMVSLAYLFVQRTKTNKLLKIQNEQKTVLIQEIHHRVKNNLQFISSLVNMQLNFSNDKSIKLALLDTSRRIKSMSLVHEFLYNVDANEIVDLKLYLYELIALIEDMVDAEDHKIKFVQEIESIEMNANNCVSIGMIASEFISNSIKHAFESQENPIIKLKLTKSESENIHFTLSDNGIGYKEIPDDSEKRLGHNLIDIFVTQLKGKYQFINDEGFKLQIQFKAPNPKNTLPNGV